MFFSPRVLAWVKEYLARRSDVVTPINRFFLAEILPLEPFAKKTYERGGIMKLSYKFEVIERETSGPVLWLMPNELNGLTLMRPSDY